MCLIAYVTVQKKYMMYNKDNEDTTLMTSVIILDINVSQLGTTPAILETIDRLQ